ncbi:MAG: prefoldin subunit beta [Candidatus Bathyarchaeia archaeon]
MTARSVDLSKLPPEAQREVLRLQQLQQTLEATVVQKQQLELKLRETESALKELKKSSKGMTVYKSVGAILVKRDPEDLKKELAEELDLLNVRIKALARQEERSKGRLQELRKKVSDTLKSLGVT